MKIHELPKIVTRKKKRVGRGYGSGRGGHTAGRGQKGQKSRGRISPLFEGTKIKKSLLQRLPLQRGRGKLKPSPQKPASVNVQELNSLTSGSKVDEEALVKAGILKQDEVKYGVKIIGTGKLEKKLKVNLPTSSGARKAIEKAGGKVE